MANARTKAKTGGQGSDKSKGNDYDYLNIPGLKDNGKKVTGIPPTQLTPEKIQPLKAPEVKHRLGIFHRNGKKPEMARVLLWTDHPYGFKETTMERNTLEAAKLTPAKDDKGDIYVVIKKETDDGQVKYLPWRGHTGFPKVSSEMLGEALNWPEIRSIDKSQTPGWAKMNNMAVWLIVGVALIVIFMIAYFGLIGSG